MSEQLTAAAQAMGIPEALVERSARARADATGQSYDDVLAAWAGGETVASAPAEPEPASEDATPAADEPTPEPATQPTPEPAAEPQPAAAPAAAPQPASAPAASAPPAAERVSIEEALEYPVVVTVPTAGITERTGFSIPSWLGALLLIIPAFGLLYLALGASADCGTGTVLRADRVTGMVENCDGSPFEGRGTGGGGGDFIAMGEQVYAQCAGCHGAQGQGSGNIPALTNVLRTFGACTDHIEWVSVGSQGFADVGTYGDTNESVDMGMPAFGGSLSEEQLAAVAAYERVRIGGGNPDEVLADCGLAEPEEGDEEGGGEEESAENGAEDDAEGPETTETTAAAEASR